MEVLVEVVADKPVRFVIMDRVTADLVAVAVAKAAKAVRAAMEQEVLLEFIEKGFQAVIVCVNAKYLDPSFLGRLLDKSFLEDLPPNVDICGENGEYHSFVFDAPIFNQPIPFTKGEIVEKKFADNAGVFDTQFYYLDLY